MIHQLPSRKNDTVDKEEKSRENVNAYFNASVTSTKKKIDTGNKIEKSQKSQETGVTPMDN